MQRPFQLLPPLSLPPHLHDCPLLIPLPHDRVPHQLQFLLSLHHPPVHLHRPLLVPLPRPPHLLLVPLTRPLLHQDPLLMPVLLVVR